LDWSRSKTLKNEENYKYEAKIEGILEEIGFGEGFEGAKGMCFSVWS
jgi:hypothetical protein